MIQLTLTEDERSLFEKRIRLGQDVINRLTEEKKALILKVDALEHELQQRRMK